MNSKYILLTPFLAATLPLSAATVFSNDFEDGDLNPEIGTWSFANTPTTSVVATAVPGDATLGNNVAMIDQGVGTLDLTLNLTNTVDLTGGSPVTIDFDVAARRTNGNAKTIFVDALDSNGDIVVRLVVGDANAFGNGGGDRQRPGYDPTSAGNANTGNSTFGSPPGSFWWGADTSIASFDVGRDAHLSLSIDASTFDFSTTSQTGVAFSATGLGNRDGGTFDDIASVQLTSVGTNHGIWIDNLVVTGTIVPEPSSVALIGLAGLGLLVRRKR